jgi:hypothetical protein
MKYLPHLLLASATALTLASCATDGGAAGGTSGSETQLGPHSAQKFVMVAHAGRTFNENDPNYARHVALVVAVEQKMVGGQQEITARASVHKDGPNGVLLPGGIDNLRVRVTEPVAFGTEPRKTAEARITNSIPAPGGKFKTVTAEASFDSPAYSAATAKVTVPGDQ